MPRRFTIATCAAWVSLLSHAALGAGGNTNHPSASSFPCDLAGGFATDRYTLDGEKDGKFLGQVGINCTVLDRASWGLQVFPAYGTVVGSHLFGEPRLSVVSLGLGVKYKGQLDIGVLTLPPLTVGLAPHYVLGQPARQTRAWGITAFGTIDVFEMLGKLAGD